MEVKAGIFLQSTSALDDTLFAGAMIFIADYNADGAIGFIVNKSYGRFLNHLEEFRHCQPFPLNHGGPVDEEHLFFLHRRPDVISGGKLIGNAVCNGGNFKEAVKAINNKSLSTTDIKIFVGYCGWDAGELEAEIEEKSWVVLEGNSNDVFSTASI